MKLNFILLLSVYPLDKLLHITTIISLVATIITKYARFFNSFINSLYILYNYKRQELKIPTFYQMNVYLRVDAFDMEKSDHYLLST